MPMSDVYNIPWIIKIVSRTSPESILDVGIGNGTYGFLFRQYFDIAAGRLKKSEWVMKIDGIEVFEEYRNPIWEYYYDTVRICDVSSIASGLPTYDVILLLDVIEHFSNVKGTELLETLVEKSRIVIVSTPNKPYPQGSLHGNSHETHLSSWSSADFENFHYYTYVLNDCNIYAISKQSEILEGLETNNFPQLKRNSNSTKKTIKKMIRKLRSKLFSLPKGKTTIKKQ